MVNQAAGHNLHIRPAVSGDRPTILAIINDAAQRYRGVIPDDRWHEPYMSAADLEREIADDVVFDVAELDGVVVGVMGTQAKGDVTLIRHAYVAASTQRGGVGTALLRHAASRIATPILIGTWRDASWAVDFYRRNGFTLLESAETARLLRRYWSIPDRQIDTSVVLADGRWMERDRVP